jgi:aspartate carbamoyltransferase
MSLSSTSQQRSLRTLTEDPLSWKNASFVSVTQITAGGLQLLFQRGAEMRTLVRTAGGDSRLRHKVLGSVFFEASTRTATSFQTAMMRLGGNSVHVDGQGGNSSAAKKGETLEDTIRCLECYTDITVLRHPVQGSVASAVQLLKKPLINAGDGIGEHPTQALLDVFTIHDELKLGVAATAPLTIVFLGDLKHGRTVHSLAKLLCTSRIWSDQLTLRYVAPEGLEMPSYVQHFCDQHENVKQETVTNLKSALDGANILYVTRIQRERFDSNEAYERVNVSQSVLFYARVTERLCCRSPLCQH